MLVSANDLIRLNYSYRPHSFSLSESLNDVLKLSLEVSVKSVRLSAACRREAKNDIDELSYDL